jgi:hypothetical protein
MDLLGPNRFFRFYLCGFMSISYDIRLSSFAMAAALLRQSFGAFFRRLPIFLMHALSDFSDGGVRTVACASVPSRR